MTYCFISNWFNLFCLSGLATYVPDFLFVCVWARANTTHLIFKKEKRAGIICIQLDLKLNAIGQEISVLLMHTGKSQLLLSMVILWNSKNFGYNHFSHCLFGRYSKMLLPLIHFQIWFAQFQIAIEAKWHSKNPLSTGIKSFWGDFRRIHTIIKEDPLDQRNKDTHTEREEELGVFLRRMTRNSFYYLMTEQQEYETEADNFPWFDSGDIQFF